MKRSRSEPYIALLSWRNSNWNRKCFYHLSFEFEGSDWVGLVVINLWMMPIYLFENIKQNKSCPTNFCLWLNIIYLFYHQWSAKLNKIRKKWGKKFTHHQEQDLNMTSFTLITIFWRLLSQFGLQKTDAMIMNNDEQKKSGA